MGAQVHRCWPTLASPCSPSLPGSGGVDTLGPAAVTLGTVGRCRQLQQVGTVFQLWIYAAKSCKGVLVSKAQCTAMGLRSGYLRDRFWLVINEKGNMVTAHQEPREVLISLTCECDALTLGAAYMKDLLLPIETPTTNAVFKRRECFMERCGDMATGYTSVVCSLGGAVLLDFDGNDALWSWATQRSCAGWILTSVKTKTTCCLSSCFCLAGLIMVFLFYRSCHLCDPSE
ncbi:PREDICTED: mitochondrial amidoxime-reducing component 1-like isoform X1 [Hipposideros armiger]|uniref:Mitochondrial amidoxime-reducing component 1-like isoform X1 n=1 Tax=Hipposideros armiger TaxID=186990 RepID=A0A8B7R631_HIPAR|nr:PREDICTED: mitochondrial amidoxime-reducing component 1-like isoform X1 [Hipposideros armiger]